MEVGRFARLCRFHVCQVDIGSSEDLIENVLSDQSLDRPTYCACGVVIASIYGTKKEMEGHMTTAISSSVSERGRSQKVAGMTGVNFIDHSSTHIV